MCGTLSECAPGTVWVVFLQASRREGAVPGKTYTCLFHTLYSTPSTRHANEGEWQSAEQAQETSRTQHSEPQQQEVCTCVCVWGGRETGH